jgi:hypothetical protein
MSTPKRSRRILALRPAKLTVACPDCDVTWRGTLRDRCWNCGSDQTIEAPPTQVKIVS